MPKVSELQKRVAELESQLTSCKSALATCNQRLTDCLASQPTPTPEPEPTPEPTPTIALSPVAAANGPVIFATGFEPGDYTEVLPAAPAGDPNFSGQLGKDMGVSPSQGAVLGPGGIRTIEQGVRVKSGKRAWRALVDPERTSGFYQSGRPYKASIEVWRGMRGVMDYYQSAWYFIHNGFPTDIFLMLMQTKQMGLVELGGSPLPMSIDLNRAGYLSVMTSKVSGDASKNVNTKNLGAPPVPRGREFNITSRWKLAQSGGRVQVWLDGTLVVDLTCRTLLPDATGAYPGIENYVTGGAIDFSRTKIPVKDSCYIDIDDWRVTLP